jgi:hypothetical protein
MLYEKVTKRCSAIRLSKDEAKASIARQFKDSELLELRRRGDKWVATLLMPKKAEFPPSDDDDTEEKKPPKDDSESLDDGPSDDSPFPPEPDDDAGEGGPEGPGEGKGEKPEIAALHELTSLVHAIADKLGIVPMGGEAPGAMDGAPLPPPPGPPGPEGPGGGGPAPQEVIHRTKLKPGEAPPGATPIGSPAFAHVEAAQLARMQSFDAFDDTPNKTIKQARAELEKLYSPHGFRVRQIKRVENGTRLAAKLSRR